MSDWVRASRKATIAVVAGIASIVLARLCLQWMLRALYTQMPLRSGSETIRVLFGLAEILLLFTSGLVCGMLFGSLTEKRFAPYMVVAGGAYAFIALLPGTTLEGIPILPLTLFGALLIGGGIYAGCAIAAEVKRQLRLL